MRGDGAGRLPQSDGRDTRLSSTPLRGVSSLATKAKNQTKAPKHDAYWGLSPPPREVTTNVTRFQVASSPARPPFGALLLLASPCPSSLERGQPRKPPLSSYLSKPSLTSAPPQAWC